MLKRFLILGFIFCLAVFTFGYNLTWGHLLPFHPDENNIVSAAATIKFFSNLNPKFFAYGAGPIYLSAFLHQFLNLNIRLSLRLFSFLASLAGLGLFYTWLKDLKIKPKIIYLVLLGITLSVGIIQQSHFGTIDNLASVITLFGLYFTWKLTSKMSAKSLLLSLVFLSLAASIKISFSIWLILPIILFIKHILTAKSWRLCFFLPVLAVIPVGLFILFNPYAILDSSAFLNSLRYESQVALGSLLVFYTRQFQNIDKLNFIINSVLFFTLNPVVLLLSALGLVLALVTRRFFFILLALLFFLPVLGWFVLWTRFFSLWFWLAFLFTALWLAFVQNNYPRLNYFFIPIFFFTSLLWSVGFLQATYLSTDPRLDMSYQMTQIIKPPAVLLQEEGNVVNLPIKYFFNQKVTMLTFNPYNLDQPQTYAKLQTQLAKADYLLISSRRSWFNHLRLADQYPQTARFYQQLFAGRLGFAPIKEVYRPFKFIFWDLSDEIYAEETFSVFDHPHLMLFKKAKINTNRPAAL
ncbi:MAG: hypothetical protein GXP43_03295 [bacterium]|nr:hypothetical protein [bacterium]